MPIKHSTSALTKEQHETQDARYAQNHQYDYIIVGTGNTSLTVGALLARSGARVCMLEAHDIPGGYAQTFTMGKYKFCAQIHYTWGCAPGGKIYKFLKKLGLEKDVSWELYDREGYDHMVMPDGTQVKIPYGWDRLVENVATAYPHEREGMEKFVGIARMIRGQMAHFPSRGEPWYRYVTKGWRLTGLARYRNKTLQDVFDECGLGKEARAVLSANAGDLMSPPKELSFLLYIALFGGYNTGAYYPTHDFKHYIDRVASVITDSPGCHIYYETEAVKIDVQGNQATAVHTRNGKTFTAPTIICGMDPQAAAHELIGWDKVPQGYQKKLSYSYCPSGMTMYVGFKPGFDLREYGFGKFNIWHLEQWDMNASWKQQLSGDFSAPWMFMSTPTLHSDKSGNAPQDSQILEIASLTDFDSFKKAQDASYGEYSKKKMALMERLIDLVQEKYIPNMRDHIALKFAGTPVTNFDFVKAPYGTAYGAAMIPSQTGLNRLQASTPWKNLYWSNQSAGYPGMYGTVSTGMSLYTTLTGDHFLDEMEQKSDDEMIAAIMTEIR